MKSKSAIEEKELISIKQSKEMLSSLMEKFNSLSGDYDEDLQKVLAAHLVVRACGHIEVCLQEGVIAYVKRDEVRDYVTKNVRSYFSKGRNPNKENIIKILECIGEGFGKKFSKFLNSEDQEPLRALKKLVSERNRIAHGQSTDIARVNSLRLAQNALDIGDSLLKILDQ